MNPAAKVASSFPRRTLRTGATARCRRMDGEVPFQVGSTPGKGGKLRNLRVS